MSLLPGQERPGGFFSVAENGSAMRAGGKVG